MQAGRSKTSPISPVGFSMAFIIFVSGTTESMRLPSRRSLLSRRRNLYTMSFAAIIIPFSSMASIASFVKLKTTLYCSIRRRFSLFFSVSARLVFKISLALSIVSHMVSFEGYTLLYLVLQRPASIAKRLGPMHIALDEAASFKNALNLLGVIPASTTEGTMFQ